jgi:hypothetical protein
MAFRNRFFCIAYSETTIAAESPEKLVRGLWSLTTQADPIRPNDIQRALSINPNHYLSNLGSESWDTIYSLAEPYRNETAPDPVTDIYISLGELVVTKGPPSRRGHAAKGQNNL